MGTKFETKSIENNLYPTASTHGDEAGACLPHGQLPRIRDDTRQERAYVATSVHKVATDINEYGAVVESVLDVTVG